jgi:protein MPE1
MTSSVFFKFKSQKDPQRVTFDGTGITVFELKRDIITISGLGDGTDFDLSIYDDAGSEEYTDDTTIIPRSSSVIVRRLPPSLGPGRGKASRYVTGKAPVMARSKPAAATAAAALPDFSNAGSEADRLNAIFAAEGASWEQQQQEMALQKRVAFKGPNNKRPLNVPDHEPPPKYVCHRCGKPGHWIQMCPTNNDPTFESKPKIKRTTGIPRSFMKKLDKPLGEGEEEEALQGGTIMLDADGNHVIVNPDTATWEKAEAKLKASAAQKQEAEEAGSKELQELGLECPIDKKLFENPVKTPCCGKTYCHDCIENALVDNDLTCPNCGTDAVLIDELATDEDMVAKVRKYEDDKVAEKKAKEKEAAVVKSPKIEVTDDTNEISTMAEAKSKSPSPETTAASPAPSTSSTSKKRAAEEPLENPRSPPKAPKSMLQAQQQNLPPGFDPKFMEMMMQYAPQDFNNNGNNNFQNQMFDQSMMGMMGMSMPGMMGMPNAMMNPMMMNNGMQNASGFNGQGMGYNSNNMNGNWQQNGGYQQQNGWNNQRNGGWSNQRGGYGGNHGGFGGGSSNDNGAYARGPANPQRARGRQQRQARNNDYNTL